ETKSCGSRNGKTKPSVWSRLDPGLSSTGSAIAAVPARRKKMDRAGAARMVSRDKALETRETAPDRYSIATGQAFDNE
ncbi:MAG: hypothetical protein R6U98_27580, partial [Pirellulaceae bacterium]